MGQISWHHRLIVILNFEYKNHYMVGGENQQITFIKSPALAELF